VAVPTCQDQATLFERYDQPMLSRRAFVARVLRQVAIAVVLLGVSLLVGIAGYMGLAGLSPVDAFLNAAMILGGMGPVDVLASDGAKVFAGVYALYSGIFFLVIAGLVLAPFLHRVLHSLHLDDDEDEADSRK
jgi:hypothetical protein